jgi:hypothetical protein
VSQKPRTSVSNSCTPTGHDQRLEIATPREQTARAERAAPDWHGSDLTRGGPSGNDRSHAHADDSLAPFGRLHEGQQASAAGPARPRDVMPDRIGEAPWPPAPNVGRIA